MVYLFNMSTREPSSKKRIILLTYWIGDLGTYHTQTSPLNDHADVWYYILALVFIYMHTVCMHAVKALARLRECASSSEHSCSPMRLVPKYHTLFQIWTVFFSKIVIIINIYFNEPVGITKFWHFSQPGNGFVIEDHLVEWLLQLTV